jgi:hypothetical protein
MRRTHRILAATSVSTLLPLAAAALLSAVLLAPSTAAGNRHQQTHVRARQRVHHVRTVRPPTRPLHRRVVIPTRIRVARIETYRPYYAGEVYHVGHGHHHAVYHFPAVRAGRHVFVRRDYCDGRVVTRPPVPSSGGHLTIRVAF